MLIGEVSKLSGLPIETLRYYDRIGLVCPKRKGSLRHYSETDLQHLETVTKMKRLMFSLEEIRIVLRADEQVDRSLEAEALNTEALDTLLEAILAKHQEITALQQNIGDVLDTLARLIAKIEAVRGVQAND